MSTTDPVTNKYIEPSKKLCCSFTKGASDSLLVGPTDQSSMQSKVWSFSDYEAMKLLIDRQLKVERAIYEKMAEWDSLANEEARILGCKPESWAEEKFIARRFQDTGFTLSARLVNSSIAEDASEEEKILHQMEMDHAVISNIYQVNRRQSMRTKKKIYKKACKENRSQMEKLCSQITSLRYEIQSCRSGSSDGVRVTHNSPSDTSGGNEVLDQDQSCSSSKRCGESQCSICAESTSLNCSSIFGRTSIHETELQTSSLPSPNIHEHPASKPRDSGVCSWGSVFGSLQVALAEPASSSCSCSPGNRQRDQDVDGTSVTSSEMDRFDFKKPLPPLPIQTLKKSRRSFPWGNIFRRTTPNM